MCRYLLTLAALVAIMALSPLGLPTPVHAQSQDGKKIVLRFRFWGDFKEIAIISKTIAAFEHDHPGVTVHGERVPPTDEYVQKLLTEQAAGLAPDVVFCGGNYTAFASRGMLCDLKPFIAQDPTVKLSDYYPQLINVFSHDGKLYALPRDIAPMGLVYYNKSLFDQAHIPYPDGSWSWDYVPHPERGWKDFLTVAKALTKPASAPGQIGQFGYAANDPSTTMDNFVYSSGGAYVDDIYHPTKMYYGTDPRIVNAAQLVQDMAFDPKLNVSPSPADLQSSGVGSHELFAQGKIAMYVTGIWEVPRFRTEITTFDWDIAEFPAGPTGQHGFKTGWSGYGITTSCQHKKEAWELLTYLAGSSGLSRLAASGLAQPAIARLANSTLWLDGKQPKNRILTTQEVPNVHMDVIAPDWNQITSIINPKLQLIWDHTYTAKVAFGQFVGPAQVELDKLNHPAFHPLLNWAGGAVAIVIAGLCLVGWIWLGARSDIKSGKSLGSRKEARAGYLFISPWIVGAIIFTLIPMLASLVLAFSSWDMIEPARWVGFGNFADMAKDDLFLSSLKVTALYTIFSVPLGMIGSLLLALLLNAKIKGQPVFRTLYYIPTVASAVAASLLWMRLFNPESGLLNYLIGVTHLNGLMHWFGWTDPTKGYVNWLGNEKTALGSLVVMSLWGIGGGMIIYLAGLQGIPQSYYDAADVDGANVWQKFRHVTLPLLTPTIFFTLIMGVIGSFQVFTQGFVMTQGGPNNATLFYVLYLYENAFQFLKMGYASALAWVLFVVILYVTLLQMKMSRWVHYEGAN